MSRHHVSAALIALTLSPATALLSAHPAPVVQVKPAVAQKPTDATLQDRIEYRLDVSPIVKTFDVKVKVELGIAVLSGTVATAAQRTEAARLAKVDGINRVENNIVVDPEVTKTLADHIKAGLSKTGDKISDSWITGKIKWFFLGDDLLKGSDINVDTANNVVTLKGTVKTTAGRDRAVFLARDTSGVHKVVDELKIVPAGK